MGWYDQIEEPIRPLVRKLRDNGINTISSCGHDMSIQTDLIPDASLKVIHDTVYNWLCEQGREPEYTIDIHLVVKKSIIFQCFAEVKIIPREG